jgi:hypothetical protein
MLKQRFIKTANQSITYITNAITYVTFTAFFGYFLKKEVFLEIYLEVCFD